MFYRLRVVSIELPALRTHKEDIGLLADVFLKMHGGRLGRSARLSKEALAALEAYDAGKYARTAQRAGAQRGECAAQTKCF